MRATALMIVGLAVSLALGLLAGCNTSQGLMSPAILFEPAVMYADTLTDAKDGFTLRSPQWAYEGEQVTFDFAPDLAISDYAVFAWPDGKSDVLTRGDLQQSYFRGLGTFKAGAEPRHNTIRATAFTRRGVPDWYFDKDKKTWVHHLPIGDPADIAVGSAQMEIVCYRVNIDLEFSLGSRVLADAVLYIIKGDGTRVSRRIAVGPADPGFELRGPDAKGRYHVRYSPTHKEVNRIGRTGVELVLSFKDGTQDTLARKIDTP